MMLSNDELREIFSLAWEAERDRATGDNYADRSECELVALRATADAAALRIADDIDFWNSIHDSNNQANSDWIRERYGKETDG